MLCFHRCLSVHRVGRCPLPWEKHPLGHPLGRHPRADTPPPVDGHCSVRYASYWNAFLFLDLFLHSCKVPASDDSRLGDPDIFSWERQEASLDTIYMATFGGYLLFFFLSLDSCPFLGALIPLPRTSGDVSSGFQSQNGQPYSHLVEAYVIYVAI